MPKPEVRVVGAPVAGATPADWLALPERTEAELLYDWGQPVYVRAVMVRGPGQSDASWQRQTTTPVTAVLRGPVGAPISVTATLQEAAADPLGRWVALATLNIPNASPSNPMTPGTRLLMQTPVANRNTEPHWELEASQSGLQWQNLDNLEIRNWVDRPDDPNAWAPVNNDAPWISLNNPIALEYDPLGAGAGFSVAAVSYFTNADDPQRFNGDWYPGGPVAPGGTASPRVPTVGTLPDPNTGAPQRQILFAQHGRQSPVAEPFFPAAGKLRVYDRSNLAFRGDRLRIRFQRNQLVKLGTGAALGGAAIEGGAPGGSYQQNAGLLDNGRDGFYPAISGQNVVITRDGSGEDASATPVPITGPDPAAGEAAKSLRPETFNLRAQVPLYQPDDLYAARWREGGDLAGSPPGSEINPFTQPYVDRNENESTAADDRRRRIVVFVDADNDGQLDLQGNFREAYRTIGFQVMVEPELKLETTERLADLGAMWHGKAGPNDPSTPLITGFGEWAFLQSLPPGNPVRRFYEQFWRPVTLQNTGNVNLGYVKPELLFSVVGQAPELLILPSMANDPFRALTLLLAPTLASAQDPRQVYLRTSIDDLLTQARPGQSLAYAGYNGGSGAWLQKAPAASSAPGSVLYNTDPSAGGVVRPDGLRVTLNVPTGTPLGTYAGALRFFNDRNVRFESTNTGVGYQYVPQGAEKTGFLERAPDAGGQIQPTESVTDPAVTVKVKVVENYVQGRTATPGVGSGADSVDVRRMPAALPIPGAGPLPRATALLLLYSTDELGRAGGQPMQTDVFGSLLGFDAAAQNFFFDLNPWSRFPWLQLDGGTEGRSQVSGAPLFAGLPAHTKPSLAEGGGTVLAAWLQRVSANAGDNLYGLFYRQLLPALGGIQMVRPAGIDPSSPVWLRTLRSSPRLLSVTAGGVTQWLLFYVTGDGSRRSLVFTHTATPDDPASWSPEHLLAVPMGLGSIEEPRALVDANTGVTWVFFSGYSQRLGRTDIFALKYDTARLLSDPRPGPDPIGRRFAFGQLSFARLRGEVLRANQNRTLYYGTGADWQITSGTPVQVYLERADVPGTRVRLLAGSPPEPPDDPDIVGTSSASGELAFRLRAAIRTSAALEDVRVIVDRTSGVVRFSVDTRTLAVLLGFPPRLPNGQPAPDPVIRADYTPLALRLTPGDLPASGGAPVMTTGFDASWYQQQVWKRAGGAGLPLVAGQADRLWLFWRRGAGVAAGGPTLYYQVFRPGVRVSAGIVRTLDDFGSSIPPEEVDPEQGALFFTATREGEAVDVQYRLNPADPGSVFAEALTIGWIPETPLTAVPMETSVNESGVDVFPTYEVVPMVQGGAMANVLHMEKLWLFWGSTRSPGQDLNGRTMQGADIFCATLAPRIGPEPEGDFRAGPGGASVSRGPAVASLFTRPPIAQRGPLVRR
ncbi:MAG: hypothetical protein HY320_11570 [Armatimonadetes bacterium]|nr:hypothetical protein [Armatimonadota bacterium]